MSEEQPHRWPPHLPRPHLRRPPPLRGDVPAEPRPIRDLLKHTQFRTVPVPEPDDDSVTEEARVHEALDLTIRVGELMLRSGAGAPQVEGAIAAVAAGAGLGDLELDITLQSILVQSTGESGVPYTLLRVVRQPRHDYARVVAIHDLVARFAAGAISVPEAAEELRRIKQHRRNWSDWMVQFANACLASAVAVMIGATAFAAAVTVLLVLAVSAVNARLARAGLPEFYANAINALIVTLLAGSVYAGAAAASFAPLGQADFAFIVAGGIVAMLPGRTMASAIEDVLFGFPLTGAGRLLAVGFALFGLIIGIAVGLSFMVRLTQAMSTSFVSPDILELRTSGANWVLALLGAFVVGGAGAVTVQSRRKLILPAAVLSAGAVGVASFLTRVVDIGPITAPGIAAVTLGLVGRMVALRLGAPAMAVVVPASLGLLPGLTIFRGLYEMVADTGPNAGLLSVQSGITTLLGAAAVLLAIATGTVFGEILAAPLDRHAGESRRQSRRRSVS